MVAIAHLALWLVMQVHHTWPIEFYMKAPKTKNRAELEFYF